MWIKLRIGEMKKMVGWVVLAGLMGLNYCAPIFAPEIKFLVQIAALVRGVPAVEGLCHFLV